MPKIVPIPNLVPGKEYAIQVRGIKPDGTYTTWSQSITFSTAIDTLSPNAPSGLNLDFSSTSMVATWNAPATPSVDFKEYEVTLVANSVTVVYNVPSTRFELTYEDNITAFSSPQHTISVSVKAVDFAGNKSTAITGTATNAAPTTSPTISGSGVFSGYIVNVAYTSVPTDLRFVRLYQFNAPGTGGAATIVWEGTDLTASIARTAEVPTSVYLEAAYVDMFNREGPRTTRTGAIISGDGASLIKDSAGFYLPPASVALPLDKTIALASNVAFGASTLTVVGSQATNQLRQFMLVSGPGIQPGTYITNTPSGTTSTSFNISKTTSSQISSGEEMKFSDVAIFAGDSNRYLAEFMVDYSGNVYASNAFLNGQINATSGSFSGNISMASTGSIFSPLSTALVPTISAVSVSGASSPYTVTFTTSAAHGLAIGDRISVSRIRNQVFNTVYRVESTPTTTTFTALLVSATLPANLTGQVGQIFKLNYVLNSSGLFFNDSTRIDGATGKITTVSAEIGGWDVNSNSISKNGVSLNSAQVTGQSSLVLNRGTFFLGLTPPTNDTASTDTVLWAGNVNYANRASANFRVNAAGSLTATGANITGVITAQSGSFTGGVNIASGGSLNAGDINSGVIINNSGLSGYDTGVRVFYIPTAAGETPTFANFKFIDTAVYSDGQNANVIIGTIGASANNITIRGQVDTNVSPAIFNTINGQVATYSNESTVSGFYIDREGYFRVGSSTGSMKFNPVGGNLTVTGTVNATAGKFGSDQNNSWNVGSGSIFYENPTSENLLFVYDFSFEKFTTLSNLYWKAQRTAFNGIPENIDAQIKPLYGAYISNNSMLASKYTNSDPNYSGYLNSDREYRLTMFKNATAGTRFSVGDFSFSPGSQIAFSAYYKPLVSYFKSITSVASANGTSVTYNCTGHSFKIGDQVEITGTMTPAGYKGTFTITSVATNTFTVANTQTGASSGTASASLLPKAIIRILPYDASSVALTPITTGEVSTAYNQFTKVTCTGTLPANTATLVFEIQSNARDIGEGLGAGDSTEAVFAIDYIQLQSGSSTSQLSKSGIQYYLRSDASDNPFEIKNYNSSNIFLVDSVGNAKSANSLSVGDISDEIAIVRSNSINVFKSITSSGDDTLYLQNETGADIFLAGTLTGPVGQNVYVKDTNVYHGKQSGTITSGTNNSTVTVSNPFNTTSVIPIATVFCASPALNLDISSITASNITFRVVTNSGNNVGSNTSFTVNWMIAKETF